MTPVYASPLTDVRTNPSALVLILSRTALRVHPPGVQIQDRAMPSSPLPKPNVAVECGASCGEGYPFP